MRVRPDGMSAIASALIAAAITLLAACSPAALDQPTVVESRHGPLDEFWFQIVGTHPDDTLEVTQYQAIQNHRIQEEMIAACMAEQGFEYIPWFEAAPQFRIAERDDDRPATDSREFAERYGFGLTTNPPDGFDAGVLVVWAGPSVDDDPNMVLRAAMSPTEDAAWAEALWGSDDTIFGDEIGCFGSAYLAINPQLDPEFQALGAEIGTFRNSVLAGRFPELAALNAEWGQCMAEAGWQGYWDPLRVRELAYDELITNSDFADSSLAAREISIALANYDCRQQISFDARRQQIDFALQQDFVNRNRAELDAWIAHAESRRS